MKNHYLAGLLFICFLYGCAQINTKDSEIVLSNTQIEFVEDQDEIFPGAYRTAEYVPMLNNKKVALVVNQTSTIGDKHLVDSLLALEVEITRIFAPEHGFRGAADAGAKVEDGVDAKTQVPIISLYGKKKKPSREDLQDVDMVLFDIQDVGVRFYTFISTLHYVMEACAEYNIPLIVLDRPNPNGYYVDGPVLNKEWSSFVGMHPVPIVYGLTIGEYAQMIQGEKWLEKPIDLSIVKCVNYAHWKTYDLPIKPSPNLPNLRSILLYPSICLFEGTTVSVGRGTQKQFQVLGHPSYQSDFSFTPKSMDGAKYPKHEGTVLFGKDLSQLDVKEIKDKKRLDFSYLIDFHNKLGSGFFNDNNFFEKLAGTSALRSQLESKMTEDEIRATWQEELATYKLMRKKYLLYEDF